MNMSAQIGIYKLYNPNYIPHPSQLPHGKSEEEKERIYGLAPIDWTFLDPPPRWVKEHVRFKASDTPKIREELERQVSLRYAIQALDGKLAELKAKWTADGRLGPDGEETVKRLQLTTKREEYKYDVQLIDVEVEEMRADWRPGFMAKIKKMFN
jgi:hypothetical protein